jgi:hypothetical protein
MFSIRVCRGDTLRSHDVNIESYSIYIWLEQKIKTMSPTELLQSRTIYDNDRNDPELMQSTLSQYQTPTYLAK